MGAANATLTEALAHLDTTWVGVRDSVLNDRHLIWIGSGISRDRFPALPALLERLFENLHTAQDPANPDCPYFKAAEEIVRDFSHIDLTGLNFRQSPAAWPPALKNDLFTQLTGRYAEVLGRNVNTIGIVQDIPFSILRLDETYSDPAVTPDAEHRFLALLIAEGAASQVVTTNWDPLIERAHHSLGIGSGLSVIACTDELDGVVGNSIVFKVHGCAALSRIEPTRYKSFMVATHNQITRWSHEERFRPFFERLRTLLRSRPSLFVGISGQDFNLQSQCVSASCTGPAFGFPPPRATFSGAIGVPQRHILEAFHGENYAQHADAINTAAALPLYGKPLFGALYVALLFEKIRVILDAGERDFASDEHRLLARTGLATLQGLLCARFDALSWDERWRELANELPAFLSRLFEVYRNQRLPANAESYAQLHPLNPTEMSADPNLKSLDLHWFCLALASLSAGAVGTWRLRLSAEADGSDGQLRIVCPSWETSLFFSRPGASAIQKLELARAIVAGSGRKVLVVYPAGSEPNPLRRNPGRLLPGGHPMVGPREVWFEDCARESASTAELVTSLKQEIIAAHTI
jgi:hypothetical protein